MKSIIKVLDIMVEEGEIENYFISWDTKKKSHAACNSTNIHLQESAISALEHMELEETD